MAALAQKEETNSILDTSPSCNETYFDRICCFDTETTALQTDKAKIIEISLRDIYGKNKFTKLVNPLETIENSHIHHITNDLIAENNGETFNNIIPMMEEWIKNVFGDDKIVYMLAHNNIYYDKMVLESEYARHSCKMPSNWLFIDSYQQIREILPKLGRGNYKLTSLYNQCAQKPLVNAHRAEADTEALAVVYNHMIIDRFNHNYYHWLNNGPFIEKSIFSQDYLNQKIADMPFGLFRSEITKLARKNVKTLGDVVKIYRLSDGNPNILTTRCGLAKFSSGRIIRKIKHFLRIIA
jgi:DNA polymerase III epsilon subunit-like protein